MRKKIRNLRQLFSVVIFFSINMLVSCGAALQDQRFSSNWEGDVRIGNVLSEPTGIQIQRWDTDPQGYYEGGSELYLTARDMARFGYLYLNKGKWGNKQVVPQEWVVESTSGHSGKDPLWSDYGYHWWIWWARYICCTVYGSCYCYNINC